MLFDGFDGFREKRTAIGKGADELIEGKSDAEW